MVKHSTAKPIDAETEPPIVEGRVPTAEDMELKECNGRYYLDNVWRICREYTTHDTYECRIDLSMLANALYTQVRDIGYELSDESERFNDVRNCLELATTWAQLCREARTEKKMFIVRRTPQNSGAVLMVQRLEHFRGQVTEMAPLAYLALVRDDQLLVTRDRVMDQSVSERVLLGLAKQREDCAVCQEFIRSRQSTVFACGHQIHSDCYEKFIAAGHKACPMCRGPVESKVNVLNMRGDSAHARLVAAAKPPAPVVAPLPQAQRPLVMTDDMFEKQMQTVQGLMERLNKGEDVDGDGEKGEEVDGEKGEEVDLSDAIV